MQADETGGPAAPATPGGHGGFDRRLAGLIVVLGMCGALGFAAFTRHAWEDYLITFRASWHLAQGHGLVFQPGERIHTFTSPLGTLLPALFAVGGGEGVEWRALWLFRLVSIGALGTAWWLALRTLTRAGVATAAAATAVLAWMWDAKTIDFAINGMETAWVVLAVVLAWRVLLEGARPWPVAAAVAALQWIRPDGCVYFAALALAWLVFRPRETPGRPTPFLPLVRGVALGAVFYLPWLLFAWYYYGTPVPHTIQAKVAHHAPGELLPALLSYPWRLLFGQVALHGVFAPAYSFFGGWPLSATGASRFIAVGAALAWWVPGLKPAGRIASAAFFLGGWYVEYIPRSPWYYPGWQALGFLAWAFLLDAGLTSTRAVRWVPAGTRIVAALLVGSQGALILGAAWQMRLQQALIEDGQRTEIGRWLRTSAAPGDRVYLEPLGYIGYFSGLKMLDYPGLASPEVVAARRAGHRSHAQVIAALQPEWLVLRPDQARDVLNENPRLLADDYRLARTFDVRAAVEAVRVLPGRGYLEFDSLYFVFRRTASSSRRP